MADEKVVWKVVNARRESIWARWEYHNTYVKGQTVRALSCTLGIFCFDTEGHALDFTDSLPQSHAGAIVVKVTPHGRATRPTVISRVNNRADLEAFYRAEGDRVVWNTPAGTVCYPAVTVLN